MQKITAVLPLAVLLLLPVAASAHEHQSFEINGVEYGFTIGSLNEPVTVDDKTGLDLRITKAGPAHHDEAAGHDDGDGDEHDDGMPVAGLEDSLKVEMIAGDKKKVTDISPVYGTPGAYNNTFYPTVATTLSYRVFGELEGTPVDLTFTCNPAGHAPVAEDTNRVQISDKVFRTHKAGSFGCPGDKAALGFPEDSSSVVDLKHSKNGMVTYGIGAIAIAALALAVVRRRS